MSFEHINSFVQAAYTVIESMLGSGIEAGRPFFNTNPLGKYEVCVLVGVFGDLQGQVICGMTKETALKILSTMLFSEVSEIDAMGESALCELKNIIVGNASTNLSLCGYECNITTPLFFIKGEEVPEFLKSIETALVIPAKTNFGTIDINLALQKDTI